MINYFTEKTKYLELYLKISSNKSDRIKNKKHSDDYIYYEAHHILPVSIFPEYSDFKIYDWNRVLLTAREHFICHLLLVKHYKSINDGKNYRKMSKAFNNLSNTRTFNSKKYQYLKLNLSHSPETIQKIAEKATGRKASDETKKKMSESRTGSKRTLETKLKMSKAQKGIAKTDSHKENMSKNHADVNGSKNPAAKKVQIFNEKNELMYETHGNFKKICEEYDLPRSALHKSYLNDGEKIFTSERPQMLKVYENKDNLKYRYWYAKYK